MVLRNINNFFLMLLICVCLRKSTANKYLFPVNFIFISYQKLNFSMSF